MLITLIILNGIVAMTYFIIAALIAPSFRLPLPGKLLWAMRISAVLFFLGCGLHHVDHAVHLAIGDLQPAVHMLLIDGAQAVAAPTFAILTIYSLRFLDVSVTEKSQSVNVKVENTDTEE